MNDDFHGIVYCAISPCPNSIPDARLWFRLRPQTGPVAEYSVWRSGWPDSPTLQDEGRGEGICIYINARILQPHSQSTFFCLQAL